MDNLVAGSEVEALKSYMERLKRIGAMEERKRVIVHISKAYTRVQLARLEDNTDAILSRLTGMRDTLTDLLLWLEGETE